MLPRLERGFADNRTRHFEAAHDAPLPHVVARMFDGWDALAARRGAAPGGTPGAARRRRAFWNVQAGSDAYTSDLHYDARDNVFANVVGRKRCVLAHPSWVAELAYGEAGVPPRNSAIDPLAYGRGGPTASGGRASRAAEVTWVQAALEPGDVLIIPAYWHHVFDVAAAARDADGAADRFVAVNRFAVASPALSCGVPLARPPPAALETVTLGDGVRMPAVAAGFYEVEPGVEAVGYGERALSVGYRHLDTAEMYGNEGDVGAAVAASGLDRRDVFVTSELRGHTKGASSVLLNFGVG